MIEVYKIIHGKYDKTCSLELELYQSVHATRTNSLKLTNTRGVLQIQDQSPQLRPVVLECTCDWLRVATCLGFATRPRCHYDLRKYYFSCKIVNLWKSLSSEVVNVPSGAIS